MLAFLITVLSTVAILSVCPGCLFPIGGKASVDAWSVEDQYNFSVPQEGFGTRAVVQPKPEQLSPLPEVVLIPFYFQFGRGKLELLKAIRVKGQGGEIHYPLRFWPTIPFTMFGNAWKMGYGAFGFCENGWPVEFNMFGSGGPSCASHDRYNDYPTPKGYSARLHPVFYRRSRSFDEDVAEAAGWHQEIEYDALFVVFTKQMGDIEAAIGGSRLSVEDRLLVYSQWREVVENILKIEKDPKKIAAYEQARQLLRAKIKQYQGPEVPETRTE